MADEEYAALQAFLIADPEAGTVIPGSGAVRKLRWRASGRGKRGGYRVIYFVRQRQGVIWMLTLYPKNVVDNIPAHVLKQVRQEIENDRQEA
jgi:mRNA-degrading endonuclease RelE of RelBE toxin-antitoxin system